jgi:hypothetical protein
MSPPDLKRIPRNHVTASDADPALPTFLAYRLARRVTLSIGIVDPLCERHNAVGLVTAIITAVAAVRWTFRLRTRPRRGPGPVKRE